MDFQLDGEAQWAHGCGLSAGCKRMLLLVGLVDLLTNAVDQWRDRLAACVREEGGHFSQWRVLVITE